MENANTTEEIEMMETSVEPLSNDQELRRIIKSKKLRLGLMNEYLYNKETGIVLREKMGHIASAMLEAQKEDILHRLTLEVDLVKKKGFIVYQDQVTALNKMIIEKSEKISDEITETLQKGTMEIYRRKQSWSEQTENMFKQGLLDEISKKTELERMGKWISQRLSSIDDKAELFLKSLEKTLGQTIKLLDQKAL